MTRSASCCRLGGCRILVALIMALLGVEMAHAFDVARPSLSTTTTTTTTRLAVAMMEPSSPPETTATTSSSSSLSPLYSLQLVNAHPVVSTRTDKTTGQTVTWRPVVSRVMRVGHDDRHQSTSSSSHPRRRQRQRQRRNHQQASETVRTAHYAAVRWSCQSLPTTTTTTTRPSSSSSSSWKRDYSTTLRQWIRRVVGKTRDDKTIEKESMATLPMDSSCTVSSRAAVDDDYDDDDDDDSVATTETEIKHENDDTLWQSLASQDAGEEGTIASSRRQSRLALLPNDNDSAQELAATNAAMDNMEELAIVIWKDLGLVKPLLDFTI